MIMSVDHAWVGDLGELFGYDHVLRSLDLCERE